MKFLLLPWRRATRRRLTSAKFGAQLRAVVRMSRAPVGVVHLPDFTRRRALLRTRRGSLFRARRWAALVVARWRLLPWRRTIIATRRRTTITRRRWTAAVARRRRPVARPIRSVRIIDTRAKRGREAYKRDTGKNTIHSRTHGMRKSLRRQFRLGSPGDAIGGFPTRVVPGRTEPSGSVAPLGIVRPIRMACEGWRRVAARLQESQVL
jgi:hypothetical protein